MLKCSPVGLTLSVLACQTALAETLVPGTNPGVSGGSVVQMLVGLAMVLAMVGLAAWLLKRFVALRGPGLGPIRVLAGAAVGPRERVVLVEVGESWLLLGVAAGQVNTLHTMPRSDSIAVPGMQTPMPAGLAFANWLRRVKERRSNE